MSFNVWLIKMALRIAGGKQMRQLKKASKNVAKAEYDSLMNIINWAKDTEYGKKHNFDKIKTIQDFQKYVPINEYKDLKPYILRHTKGEENVLFPGKPIMYATTSGTTKDPKWIPITEKYDKECYSGLSKLWFYTIQKENPHAFDGYDLSIVGKAVEGYTEDGTPYGSFSGQNYRDIPPLLKSRHVCPYPVFKIANYDSRYYTFLRFTIPVNVTIIITGNPSTLIAVHRKAQQWWDKIVEDVEKGTLNADLDIDPEVRREIEEEGKELLKPNPKKAEELRELKRKYGEVYPKYYWPNLGSIVTWKCGNSGLYLQHTKDYFPDNVKIRDFGYIATEARAGMILDYRNNASVLVSHLLFFEFIKKEDINEENPKVYTSSELEEGQQYYIIVTTPGGLYRYYMNDIVRIDGFYNEFPMVTFIQKGAGVTSLTGEKLYEEQLILAMNDVEQSMGMKTNFYIAFADFDSSTYHLYVEFKKDYNKSLLEEFCVNVDKKLKEFNEEYEIKRKSDRLKPLVLHTLKDDAFDKFKTECMERGYRDGQFKLVHLMIDDNRKAMFDKLVVDKGLTSSR
jgi:hypothetical protein